MLIQGIADRRSVSEASTSTFQEKLSGENNEQIRRYPFWRRS